MIVILYDDLSHGIERGIDARLLVSLILVTVSQLTKTEKTAEDTISSVQETMTPCSSSSSVSIRKYIT